MTIKDIRAALEPFLGGDDVITLKAASNYTNQGNSTLQKFGLEVTNTTPVVIGGLLELGLVVTRPKDLVEMLARDATAEGFERDIND